MKNRSAIHPVGAPPSTPWRIRGISRFDGVMCIVVALSACFIAAGNLFAETPLTGDDKPIAPPRDPLLKDVTPGKTLVLWHTYRGTRSDVLDFSGHGSIGEYLTANRFPIGKDRNGLRFHGDWKSGEGQGYRVMESDVLALNQGTISAWIWADEALSCNGVLIASAADPKHAVTLRAGRGKVEIKSTLTGNKPLKAKIAGGSWFHLAIVFSPNRRALFINGKKTAAVSGAGRLDGASGLWVGHSGNRKKSFAGALGDLRIDTRALTAFPSLDNPPDPKYTPSGIVLHYDFQSTAANPTRIQDVSGNGLDGVVEAMGKTGIPVNAKNAPGKHDRAWRFLFNRGGPSVIHLPRDDRLKLEQGTITAFFALNKMAFGATPFRVFLEAGRPDTDASPLNEINFYCVHPNSHKSLDPNKVTPFYTIGVGPYDLQTDTIPKALYVNKWIKLVVAWDRKSTTVWINDMRYDHLQNAFGLYGDTSFIYLGSNNAGKLNNHLGMDASVSDFTILNYKLTTYSKKTMGADEKPWKAKTPPHFKIEKRAEEDRYYEENNPW